MEALAQSWVPYLLSILRFMSGLLLLQHGTRKLLQFPAPQPNFVLNSMSGYAGIIELVEAFCWSSACSPDPPP
jgi:putative oxidoreductase